MKKLFTITLILVLLMVNLILPVSATEVNEKLSFINNEVALYMKAVLPNAASVSVSDVFPIYNSSTGSITNEAVFVIYQNSLIGMMIIAHIDGEYYSTYYNGVEPSLAAAYSNNREIALLSNDEQLAFCQASGQVTKLTTNINKISDNRSAINSLSQSSFQVIGQKDSILLNSTRTIVPEINEVIHVQHVQNSGPKCWVACAAMVINTIRGTSWDTEALYNYICELYPNQNPEGTSEWYNKIFYWYVITAQRTTSLTYTGIYNSLYLGWPIINNVVNLDSISDNDPTNDLAHGVLLTGMLVSRDTTTQQLSGCYIFDDPNISTGTVLINVNHNTLVYGSNYTYYIQGGIIYDYLMYSMVVTSTVQNG